MMPLQVYSPELEARAEATMYSQEYVSATEPSLRLVCHKISKLLLWRWYGTAGKSLTKIVILRRKLHLSIWIAINLDSYQFGFLSIWIPINLDSY